MTGDTCAAGPHPDPLPLKGNPPMTDPTLRDRLARVIHDAVCGSPCFNVHYAGAFLTAADKAAELLDTGTSSPVKTSANPIVLPTVEEASEAVSIAAHQGGSYTDYAQAALDLIASRVRHWKPVEPGADIKAGTRIRIEWDATDEDALESVERTNARDITVDPTDVARWYIDPATVPAEPEDPCVAALAEVLEEEYGSFTGGAAPYSPTEYHRAAIDKILAALDAARGAES